MVTDQTCGEERVGLNRAPAKVSVAGSMTKQNRRFSECDCLRRFDYPSYASIPTIESYEATKPQIYSIAAFRQQRIHPCIAQRQSLRSTHHHPLINPPASNHLRDGAQVGREAMIAILAAR